MSTQPTAEQIRKARHAGFINASKHQPDATRKRLAQAYSNQDARRERNVSKFVTAVKGGA